MNSLGLAIARKVNSQMVSQMQTDPWSVDQKVQPKTDIYGAEVLILTFYIQVYDAKQSCSPPSNAS